MGAIYLFFHSLNFETFKERSEGFFPLWFLYWMIFLWDTTWKDGWMNGCNDWWVDGEMDEDWMDLQGNEGTYKQTKDRLTERASNRPTDQMNEQTNERTNARTNERTNERTNGRTNERTSERTSERANERASERARERENERTNERTNGWTNEWMDTPFRIKNFISFLNPKSVWKIETTELIRKNSRVYWGVRFSSDKYRPFFYKVSFFHTVWDFQSSRPQQLASLLQKRHTGIRIVRSSS